MDRRTDPVDHFYTNQCYRTDPATETESKESEYSKKHGLLFHVITQALASVKNNPIECAVDIGGGNGSTVAMLRDHRKVAHAISYDVYVPENGLPGIEYKKGSVERILDDFSENSVDIALMIEVIEHLFDPDSAVEGVRAIVKQNGVLILTTPNLSSLTNRFMLLLGKLPWNMEISARHSFFGRPRYVAPHLKGKEVVGHIRLFTFDTIVEFLEYYGWTIENAFTLPQQRYPEPKPEHFARKADYYKFRLANILISMTEKLSVRLHKSLGTHIVVVCRKSSLPVLKSD